MLSIKASRCSPLLRSSRRQFCSDVALDEWIASPKQLVMRDTFHRERVSDLYITLPTRDGTRRQWTEPKDGAPLGYGHHLAFFHPRNAEANLRKDGTDAEFCPPEPFTRRMWAGGKISWNTEKPLLIGRAATATSTIGSIEKKGFEKGSPMLFVTQRIAVRMDEETENSVEEERVHVYLPIATGSRTGGAHTPRKVKDAPVSPHDFSFSYTPTPTTLFRFSALTFNGHHIHLDKEYARSEEGYPERLVHGPLTALMLLESLGFSGEKDAQLRSLAYRAQNPLFVNSELTLAGSWENAKTAKVWCVNQDGVVGMTGTVECV
ncbi:hypothetical protein PC9H_000883 [Pleurotus ostreatus]|uniref:Uncharacterized protein n=2 Tax=Pleurotus ostreatus TaxID=5322 RepID=A0A8H7A5K9_PLEOS|nr:uncharacterized protein PC9H_000883 [Pleurotus ostreatus]KAF7440537.1 hypothetical protein PC9H_000883 [Pleurotus ostreatus]